MKKHIFTIYIAISLLICTVFPIKAGASNFDIIEYQKIIEEVNTKYNRQFHITDLITFKNTICNKLSPLEFENMLVQDAIAIQETPLEDNIIDHTYF